jgi:hypothetical protein
MPQQKVRHNAALMHDINDQSTPPSLSPLRTCAPSTSAARHTTRDALSEALDPPEI